MAQFIVKERTVSPAGRNSFSQVKYGKWRTLAQYEHADPAYEHLRRQRGLTDRAIFYKGKRITAGLALLPEWRDQLKAEGLFSY